VTQPSLDTLRELADRAAQPTEIPPDVLTAVRRRRRRIAIASGTATAAGVVAVVTVVALVANNASPQRLGQTTGGGHGTPTPSASAHRAVFAPLPTPPAPAGTAEPTSMLALIGGGAERLAIVDTGTGAVRRYLQKNGSQALMVPGPDRTAYQWDLHGCRYSWTAISTTTGRSAPALKSLGNVSDIAFSSTGQRIGYVSIGPEPTVTIKGHRYPAGCSASTRMLVVSDPASHAMKAWPLPAGYDNALYPAFDATGMHLFFDLGRTVRVLDLNHDRTLAAAKPLTAQVRFIMLCSKSTPPKVASERRRGAKTVSPNARWVFSIIAPTVVAPARKSRRSRPAK